MLFHGLHAAFERDDVVLADRFYCSYWDVALRLGRGMDVVMRAPQRRAVALRRGQRLGHADHLIVWTKPQRPTRYDERQAFMLARLMSNSSSQRFGKALRKRIRSLGHISILQSCSMW